MEKFKIDNNSFQRAWKKSSEDLFFNRCIGVAFLLGSVLGGYVVLWVYNL